jgi:hypothetical protein
MSERIKQLAKEAGIEFTYDPTETPMRAFAECWAEELEKFAALIRADEREACAVLAQQTICDTHIPTGINIYGNRAAKAIRARGNT